MVIIFCMVMIDLKNTLELLPTLMTHDLFFQICSNIFCYIYFFDLEDIALLSMN